MLFLFWAFLSFSISALPDANSQPSREPAYSIIERYSEDSSFDQSAVEPIDASDPLALSELPTYATDNGNLFDSVSPEEDGSAILLSTSNVVSDGRMSSSAGLIPAFETAFAPNKDPEFAKPPCTSPTSAACCVENSMFTSCVWWDLDRMFCEDPNNYACCESIQDYIGSNCEKVGEEGKDWDWLEDILRTPIIIEPPINPLQYFPPIPLIPERV